MANHPNRNKPHGVIVKDGEKFLEWTVKVRIHASWVADGFNLTAERMHTMVNMDLQGAYTNEIEAEVVDSPDPAAILSEQGYGKIDARYPEELKALQDKPRAYP